MRLPSYEKALSDKEVSTKIAYFDFSVNNFVGLEGKAVVFVKEVT